MTETRTATTIVNWAITDEGARRSLLTRPAQKTSGNVLQAVEGIVRRVRDGGDTALKALTVELDGARLDQLRVSPAEIDAALDAVPAGRREALEIAITSVTRFHEAQRDDAYAVVTWPGVYCERVSRPIDSVGLYVPGGSAPLPSTLIMLAVPARLAGCRRRVVATPPRRDGSIDPLILVAATLGEIDEIYKIGGAQAIAALAYGTATVPKVDKLFGPGNAWVTAAKQLVAQDPEGAVSDMPAGPSELLVIADDAARADWVAADLLSQAEHGPDSQVMLITPSVSLAEGVAKEIDRQLRRLPRASIAATALGHSATIVVDDLQEAFAISNRYAPEHLILNIANARSWLDQVQNAGSVFLGAWSPEAVGDYCSGTNHVLPTYGFARALSGLSVRDFCKAISVQELTKEGMGHVGPAARTLAEAEGLLGHALAVNARLSALSTDVPTDGRYAALSLEGSS